MRPDVKLGVVVSLVVVLVAGGYYIYRDAREVPIPVSDDPLMLSGKPAPSSETGTPPANGTVGGDRAGQRSTATPSPPTRRSGTDRAAAPRGSRPASARPSPRQAGRAPKNVGGRAVDRRKGAGHAQGTPGPSRADRTSLGPQADATTPTAAQRAPGRQVPGTTAGTGTPSPGQSGGDGSVVGPRPGKQRATRSPTARPSARRPPGAGATSPSSAVNSGESGPASRGAAIETHRVQPGDTFASLAEAYYGHERFTQFLIDHNPQIPEPSRLRVGVIVKIPPAPLRGEPPAARRATPDATAARTAGTGSRTYTVQPGDSFYRIAGKVLGDTSRWQELFDLNKHLVHGDPKRLQVGQVLTVPD